MLITISKILYVLSIIILILAIIARFKMQSDLKKGVIPKIWLSFLPFISILLIILSYVFSYIGKK